MRSCPHLVERGWEPPRSTQGTRGSRKVEAGTGRVSRSQNEEKQWIWRPREESRFSVRLGARLSRIRGVKFRMRDWRLKIWNKGCRGPGPHQFRDLGGTSDLRFAELAHPGRAGIQGAEGSYRAGASRRRWAGHLLAPPIGPPNGRGQPGSYITNLSESLRSGSRAGDGGGA